MICLDRYKKVVRKIIQQYKSESNKNHFNFLIHIAVYPQYGICDCKCRFDDVITNLRLVLVLYSELAHKR